MGICPEFHHLSAGQVCGNRNMPCCVEVNADPACCHECVRMKSDHLSHHGRSTAIQNNQNRRRLRAISSFPCYWIILACQYIFFGKPCMIEAINDKTDALWKPN